MASELYNFLEENIREYKGEDDLVSILNYYHFYDSFEIIENQWVFKFFSNFFGDTGQKVTYFICEPGYWSEDFIQDYQEFYSSCFISRDDSPKCARFHFFSIDGIDKSKFIDSIYSTVISGNSKDELWTKNYIGFFTIKPIANSLIGFSLFKPYSKNIPTKDNSSRLFWGVRNYTVRYYGLSINLDALPFQQQDKVLGACASIAIWSLLQKVCVSPNHQISSIGKITKKSGKVDAKGGRLIPSIGLDRYQISKILASNGLSPEVITGIKKKNVGKLKDLKILENSVLKRMVNAYYRLEIPMLLGFIPRGNILTEYHAVTICGHAISTNQLDPKIITVANLLNRVFSRNENTILWKADSIVKFYAHDDRWGPYARIEFAGLNNIQSDWSIVKGEQPGYAYFLIAGVPPEILTPHLKIENIVLAINEIVRLALKDDAKGILMWDLYIQRSSDFKAEIRNTYLNLKSIYEPDSIELKYIESLTMSILRASLPNYIWRAQCNVSNSPIIEIIFDSTTTIDHEILLKIFPYYTITNDALLHTFNDKKQSYSSKSYRKYQKLQYSHFEFLLNDLIQNQNIYIN